MTDFIEQICVNETEIKGTSLESLLACRLVTDYQQIKNPGLRQIGTWGDSKVNCRESCYSIGDANTVVGNLQLCGGQDAMCEAFIYFCMTYLNQMELKQSYLRKQRMPSVH